MCVTDFYSVLDRDKTTKHKDTDVISTVKR